MMKFVEVLRPNPIRIEQCEILDKLRRIGGEHIKVRCADGAEFMAEKHMGQWGQPDGWFDCLTSEVSRPHHSTTEK